MGEIMSQLRSKRENCDLWKEGGELVKETGVQTRGEKHPQSPGGLCFRNMELERGG